MDMAAARYYTVRRLKMEAIIEMGLVGRLGRKAPETEAIS